MPILFQATGDNTADGEEERLRIRAQLYCGDAVEAGAGELMVTTRCAAAPKACARFTRARATPRTRTPRHACGRCMQACDMALRH